MKYKLVSAVGPLLMKWPHKARNRELSKQAMRDETERLVKEALERKTLTVTQGKNSYREQMRKVRRAKSRFSRSRRASGAVHV